MVNVFLPLPSPPSPPPLPSLSPPSVSSQSELVLTVVLLLVAVYNTAIYLYAYLGPHRIRLTAEQKKLLAVSDSGLSVGCLGI